MSNIELLIEKIVRKEYKIETMEELEEREYYRQQMVEKWKKGELIIKNGELVALA